MSKIQVQNDLLFSLAAMFAVWEYRTPLSGGDPWGYQNIYQRNSYERSTTIANVRVL